MFFLSFSLNHKSYLFIFFLILGFSSIFLLLFYHFLNKVHFSTDSQFHLWLCIIYPLFVIAKKRMDPNVTTIKMSKNCLIYEHVQRPCKAVWQIPQLILIAYKTVIITQNWHYYFYFYSSILPLSNMWSIIIFPFSTFSVISFILPGICLYGFVFTVTVNVKFLTALLLIPQLFQISQL